MNRARAFTLIELLIVVAIIGILAAIAVPNFLNAQVRARISKAYADTRALADAFESYRLDRNTLPPVKLPAWPNGGYINPMSLRFIPLTTPTPYLTSIPLDPFGWPEYPPATGHYPGEYSYDYYWWKKSSWIVHSLGPARTNLGTQNIVPYASSNGLISLGYINRYGHGSVGGWQTPFGRDSPPVP